MLGSLRSAVLVLSIAASPLAAQMPSEPPGKPDPARVAPGHYTVEPNHTQVRFTVMHLGYTPFSGFFSGASGSLDLDAKRTTAIRLTVEVPVASAWVTSPKLTEELRSPMFFDPARYPTMRFVTDGVRVDGMRATIVGQLTMHGVTRPLTLNARFVGAGTMMGKRTIGFTATGMLKRSDFGITAALPLVSDEVQIDISAAFEQPA